MSTSREPLSRERVLSAAVHLVDTEGLAALTMRGLAARLGVEAMSLYYYLPGKEGLLDGLAEAVVGEVDAATSETLVDGEGWRTAIRHRFLTARRVMLRHPWAPGLLGSRQRIPARLFGYYERLLGTLVDAGFSYRLAHRALHAFGSMPLGFVQEVFNPADGDATTTATEAELTTMAEAFPHMAAMVAAELHDAADPQLGWCDSQTEFEFTLDLILDGLERLHAGQRQRGPVGDSSAGRATAPAIRRRAKPGS